MMDPWALEMGAVVLVLGFTIALIEVAAWWGRRQTKAERAELHSAERE